VRDGPARTVPNHLRDRHRPGSDSYGPYRYPHDYSDAIVEQQYLPDGLERGMFFRAKRGWEASQAERLARAAERGPAAADSPENDNGETEPDGR